MLIKPRTWIERVQFRCFHAAFPQLDRCIVEARTVRTKMAKSSFGSVPLRNKKNAISFPRKQIYLCPVRPGLRIRSKFPPSLGYIHFH
mmetsp:Transcript_7050/g.14158  ORF Transcript_7050/g.14158 Transcript_7050/m.14158 type:complete len:88 (+) Transcript_7050:623-886(+)